MEYIKYDQYGNNNACQPPIPHPNGLIGNEYTAELIAQHIAAGHGVSGWKQRISNLHFVRLPNSTKPESSAITRAARQGCYEPVGVPMSVQEYVTRVANLPADKRITNPNAAYEDLWWDCQGGQCRDQAGVVGRPYIRFLSPHEPDGE